MTRELDYANLNRRRAPMESSNSEVARLALGVDMGGFRWCPNLKNRMGAFLATSSCP
jgi:hypothetical protein